MFLGLQTINTILYTMVVYLNSTPGLASLAMQKACEDDQGCP
jgi:hypothetical protein